MLSGFYIVHFFFSVKRKGIILPRPSTLVSSAESLSNLEVGGSHKNSSAPSLYPPEDKACFLGDGGLKLPRQSILPVKSHNE